MTLVLISFFRRPTSALHWSHSEVKKKKEGKWILIENGKLLMFVIHFIWGVFITLLHIFNVFGLVAEIGKGIVVLAHLGWRKRKSERNCRSK